MKYLKKPVVSGVTRFTKSPMSDVEFSRMKVDPTKYTTFNAGEIVPIYYAEILPHDTFSIDLDFIVRQTTLLKPAMGNLTIDIYAYWVSNQTVNDSWKNVQGENTSGFWTAPEVELAPLYPSSASEPLQIPPESVADYYGFPTQAPIQAVHLKQMNDLKFRGYLEIYNNFFRDENYQPPISYSKLNLYNGFLQATGTKPNLIPDNIVPAGTPSDGSFGAGSVVKALFGDGSVNTVDFSIAHRLTSWSALDRPLKANKFHDPFTSVLPAPQKGAEVVFGIGGTAPVDISLSDDPIDYRHGDPSKYLKLSFNGERLKNSFYDLFAGFNDNSESSYTKQADVGISNVQNSDYNGSGFTHVNGLNIKAVTDLSQATGIPVNDLRTAIATQQVYEQLARGGSRYLEIIRSFFGIETESPFTNIPIELGHIRQTLDMYQVAQTSSTANEETPQGNLTAFGYTTKGGKLFTRTFLEHGYVHVFAVVRQKNLYSTYLAPDNFRRSTLDFFMPQLANIGEQPIMLRTLNPFIADRDDNVLGYQEAWWEYRYEPDQTSGYFRQGLSQTLKGWTYADKYDPSFTHVNSEWLKSNAREVVDDTLAVTSEVASQFFGLFTFTVDKQRPMPVYSVPGLDTI